MRRPEQVWWVSATALSLAAFSFFAGLGLRGLFNNWTQGTHATNPFLRYPQVASAGPRVPLDPDLKPSQLYMEVLRKLQLYYVEQLPSNTSLAYGSVDSMLSQLNDPNTRVLSVQEMEAYQNAASGEYSGLGAALTIRRYNGKKDDAAEEPAPGPKAGPPQGVKTITVVATAPGSPAEKAGLLPGDRITELDGHWVAPLHVSYRVLTQLTDPLGPQDGRPRDPEDPPEKKPVDPERDKARKEADEARARWKTATDLASAMKLLLATDPAEHELTIERGTPSKTVKVKVTLANTKVAPFTAKKLNASTGYLQILAFNGSTARQAAEALADFKASGIKNLVVDLRRSVGGSLDAARDVAGLVAGDVKFAVLKERDADRKVVERPLLIKGATVALKPAAVTVLVDGGTAGSSELLAAALRDHLGARLLGSTTFGDGSEQEIMRLDNGAGVSITRAHMLTSKGVDFDGKGLQADVTPAGDALEAAVKAFPG